MTINRANWSSIPILIVAICLILASCNKDTFETPIEDIEAQPENLEIDINALPEVVTVDGRKTLKFGNLEHFNATLGSISKMNRKALDKWERSLSFVSMRNQFESLEDQYVTITTEAELQRFKDANRTKVQFSEEGELEMLVDMYHVGSLINPQGIIQISSMIQQFTRDKVITIVDGDHSKLAIAHGLQESDPAQSIYISPIETTLLNARSNGPNLLECESDWDNDRRRVKMSLEVVRWSTPETICQTQYVCVRDPETFEEICEWQTNCFETGNSSVTCNMELEVKSQRRGIFGIAFASRADIDATFGANVHQTTVTGSLINHWMPVNESEIDERRLERTYQVDFIPSISFFGSLDYCFGPTHVAGIINGGTNCHVWN
ncbi:MAG: hypothetical protein HRU41_00255 [Saprospiraceae bacterium]|nr:hypothetical protein [Saprospiraceae bacterium]